MEYPLHGLRRCGVDVSLLTFVCIRPDMIKYGIVADCSLGSAIQVALGICGYLLVRSLNLYLGRTGGSLQMNEPVEFEK